MAKKKDKQIKLSKYLKCMHRKKPKKKCRMWIQIVCILVEGYGSWVFLSTAPQFLLDTFFFKQICLPRPPNNHKYIARLEKILSRNIFRRETSGAPDKTVSLLWRKDPTGRNLQLMPEPNFILSILVPSLFLPLFYSFFTFLFYCKVGEEIEEGNGSPLQYSCLENPMDRRA